MSSHRQELLKDLAREDHYLREEAHQSVENGMAALVNSKRLLQKISVNEQEGQELGTTIAELMLAGNALRMSLQTLKAHHQRSETPWIDHDGGIHLILRNSMEFETKVNQILGLIREAMQERRKIERR